MANMFPFNLEIFKIYRLKLQNTLIRQPIL